MRFWWKYGQCIFGILMIKRSATHTEVRSGGFSWYIMDGLIYFCLIIKDHYNEYCDPYSSHFEWVKLKGEQNSEPLWIGAKENKTEKNRHLRF